MFIGRYYSTCAALKNPKLQSMCLRGCMKSSLPLASSVAPTPSSSTCFISADTGINVLEKQSLLAQVGRTRKPKHIYTVGEFDLLCLNKRQGHLFSPSVSKQTNSEKNTTLNITQTCTHMCSLQYVLGFSICFISRELYLQPPLCKCE